MNSTPAAVVPERPMASSPHRFALALAAYALGIAAVSCGGERHTARGASAPAGAVGETPPRPRKVQATSGSTRATPARSHSFATLPATTGQQGLGPFLARGPATSLAAWIAPSEQSDQRDLIVAELAPDGAPLAQVRVVAHVPREVTTLVVGAAGGASDGWLLAWGALRDRGESVTLLGLTPDGAPRGEPVDVQRTADHVAWATLVPTAHGSIALWAEETSAGSANMLSVPVGADGKPRGMPMRVAAGVDRWQAVPAKDGAALVLARAPSPEASMSRATLSWQRLDAAGRPEGGAQIVARGLALDGDVDIAPVPGPDSNDDTSNASKWLLAWTDRTPQDEQIILATVDDAGHVEGPVPAMSTVGASSLAALASGRAGIALAWQEPGRRARESRTLHLSRVVASGVPAADPTTSIEIAPDVAPELVATDDGFAVLGAARACEVASGACSPSVVPLFVRFGPALEPLQSEPLYLGSDAMPAALAWNLRCADRGAAQGTPATRALSADSCVVLAATGASPTPVFTVDLAARKSPFAPPLPPLPPADVPRVMGISTVAAGERYDDLAVARVGLTTLVATLAGAGAQARPRGRARATIAVRAVDTDGHALGPAATITSRALPLGGFALAAGSEPDDGGAAAWVALEDGDPHVVIAHLDAQGKKTRELRVTPEATSASSVALAWTGDGWLVAWSESHDGAGDVVVTKVDRNLHRAGHEERVRHAPGDASDIALAVYGAVAWIAWSDPRDNAREGAGDIFVTTLHPSDATRAGEETRVLATARHSRSPQLAPLKAGGALVAWIEDAPTGLEGASAAVAARLDIAGRVLGSPAEIALAASGRPTSIAFVPGATDETAEAVIARAGTGGMTLDSIRLAGDATTLVKAWPLVDLDAPPAFDVAFAATADGLVYDDVGAGPGERRIRRASVRWPR
jgi:hypothetical protein